MTGASGFIGRHLLDALKDSYQIIAMARRSQARCGAPFHPNISWYQVDIGDREPLAARVPDGRRGRRRRRHHPPRRSLRLHRRRAPRVLADQRQRPAQRPRGVQEHAAAETPRLRELGRRVRLPAAGARAHGDQPSRRRAPVLDHQAHRRGDAARVPRRLPLRDRALRRAVLGLVRVRTAVLLPRHLALPRLERPPARRARGCRQSPTCMSARCRGSSARCSGRSTSSHRARS